MKKLIPLALAITAAGALCGCQGLANTAAQLKGDAATVDLMTPYGSFHRSMPPWATNFAQPVIVVTNAPAQPVIFAPLAPPTPK